MRSFAQSLSRLLEGERSPELLCELLAARGGNLLALMRAAQAVRLEQVGDGVYLRGLIELGNACEKDCYYCGIRRSNRAIHRYAVDKDAVVNAAAYAHQHGFASLAIQAGERTDAPFTQGITQLLQAIHSRTKGELGITLSLGEQSRETYSQWRTAGASRYLLRIETSSPQLYSQLHPQDALHAHDRRIRSLQLLREEGYHVGTGVMIGLPNQDTSSLAQDLIWLHEQDEDMVGMGPYLTHPDTPLAAKAPTLWPIEERFDTAIAMVATLRILMPTINIAATTALQAIRPDGRDWAIRAGANVLMPNITPNGRQDSYALYARKPRANHNEGDSIASLRHHVETLCGCRLALHEQGNSLHFLLRHTAERREAK